MNTLDIVVHWYLEHPYRLLALVIDKICWTLSSMGWARLLTFNKIPNFFQPIRFD